MTVEFIRSVAQPILQQIQHCSKIRAKNMKQNDVIYYDTNHYFSLSLSLRYRHRRIRTISLVHNTKSKDQQLSSMPHQCGRL